MKHWSRFFFATGAWLVVSMSASNTPAQTPQAQPSEGQHSGVTVDLTGVVVAALTLGFGYGVLKTFQGGTK